MMERAHLSCLRSNSTRSFICQLYAQAGALAEACKSYAAEARRLASTAEAEEVAAQFGELQQTLEVL